MMKRSFIWTMLILVLGIVPILAQTASCPAMVDDALRAVGDNCGDLSRNSACYGHNQVEATFFAEMPEDYFSVPSDRAGLNEIDTLTTTTLDMNDNRWGVAVMNIQANIPNTVPGQAVMMMLMGGATIQNDVNPETANIITDPVSTVAVVESNIYRSPSESTEVINVVSANSIVLVDGFNTTRAWMRIVNDGVIGWIQAGNVARLAAIDALPIVGANNPTPMQAFYLTTGIGEVECNEADSVVAVQSPENITVDLTVNGVDIKVGSMITFQNLDSQTVSLTVHRGNVSTIFGNTISAGQSAIGVVNSSPELGNIIVAWGDAVPATDEEKQLGERVQVALNNVARSNNWDEREIEPVTEENPTTASGELIHIVASGETLFGIGRLYEASLPEIVARNDLSAPYTLFSGDRLVIPNPGSGFVGLPSSGGGETTPTVTEEPTTDNVCDTFRLTSPLSGGVPTENTTYYWDGVAGATQYQINVYDSATGLLMGTFYTNGAETSIMFSAGELGVGGAMQWEVIALVNESPLCSTGLSQPLVHGAPIEPETPIVVEEEEEEEKSSFSINWKCDGLDLVVTWKNAYPDDTVDITISDVFGGQYSHSGKGESGEVRQGYTGYNFIKAVGVTSSGERNVQDGSQLCY